MSRKKPKCPTGIFNRNEAYQAEVNATMASLSKLVKTGLCTMREVGEFVMPKSKSGFSQKNSVYNWLSGRQPSPEKLAALNRFIDRKRKQLTEAAKA